VKAARSLTATVIRPIVFFAALAMIAQLIGVIAEYWLDRQELSRHVIEREADALFAGVQRGAQIPAFELPTLLRGRYGPADGSYLARIRTGAGVLLYTNCQSECPFRLLPTYAPAPGFWMSQLDPGSPEKVGGGKAYPLHSATVIVEIAILEDRAGVFLAALLHEVIDHMALPMSLMLVVVVGASFVAIRRALRPIKAAADLAARLDPTVSEASLPLAGMPREIAALIQAVNNSVRRVHDVVQAQKIFTSAISHEVRTPIAIARLELEKIADPRARKVEKDLESLTRLVEQLTTLARLESVNLGPLETIAPAETAEHVVGALAPIVFDSGRSIELIDRGGEPFPGRPGLVENALRNLIENAIRHTREGSKIIVEVGPGPQFSVRDILQEDKSTGFAKEAKGAGLGLKIVRRIAETQGGSFSFEKSPDGLGSMANLRFGR
jgi:signal transduction histidine kinase